MEQSAITAIVEPAVVALGYQLWGCEAHFGGKQPKIVVYIDSPSGVNVEDCAEVTRQITALFAVEAPEMQEAALEVSSPGLDRPLFTLEQFQQYIGRRVKLRLKLPLESGQRNFQGQVLKAADDEIVLDMDGEQWRFSLSNIDRANLSPEI